MTLRRVTLITFVLGCFWLALLFLDADAQHCGVERHQVKDLLDHPQLSTFPVQSSVTELRSLTPPPKITSTLPRQVDERGLFKVGAWVLGYKLETDQDYHVVISEVGHQDQTMVVEIPSPRCAPRYAALFTQERKLVDKLAGPARPGKMTWLKQPASVDVTGVLFFDKIHGQTGVAPNGVELHPVISLTIYAD